MTNIRNCENCGIDITNENKNMKFCSVDCRNDNYAKQRNANKKIIESNCLYCDKTIHHRGKFCSERCCTAHRNEQKYEGKIENIDYIRCPVCNQKVGEISAGHAKMHGFNTPTELANKYGLKNTKCQRSIDRFAGKNNPGYQHGGLLSPFSKNNTNITEEERLENQRKALKNAEGTRPNEIQSWLNKGYTEEEARALVSKRQATNNGLGWSKISQRMFWSIYNSLENKNNIFFATKDENNNLDETSNYELKLTFPQRTIIPDFINTETKHVIEFDGDYWHREDMRDLSKEIEKVNILEQNGYKVLRIKECDYTNNPNGEIEKCIKFLMT